jgi:hypothetical protein
LIDGDLLGRWGVRDSDIDGVVLEIVDRLGGVALIPGDFEGIGAVADTGLDELVGKDWAVLAASLYVHIAEKECPSLSFA